MWLCNDALGRGQNAQVVSLGDLTDGISLLLKKARFLTLLLNPPVAAIKNYARRSLLKNKKDLKHFDNFGIFIQMTLKAYSYIIKII